MSTAAWWIGGTVVALVAITALGVFIGKLIGRGERQYEALMADHDREQKHTIETGEQWCCYAGPHPDDALWRYTEPGSAAAFRRARHPATGQGAKVAVRTYGPWQDVPITDTAATEGAA